MRRISDRSGGVLLSILLHGGVAALACIGVVGHSKGGGSNPGFGSGLESGVSGSPMSATFRGAEETIEAARIDDTPSTRSTIEDDPAPVEILESLPICFDPFAPESKDGVAVSRIPSSGEVSARFSSSRDRFERLPTGGQGTFGSGIAAGGSGGTSGKGTGTGSGVGDGAGDAVALYRPSPVYPNAARRSALEGVVLVDFTVEPDGTCTHVAVAESSGYSMFDDAAVRAVQEWRYQPAQSDGQAIAQAKSIRIVFKLSP